MRSLSNPTLTRCAGVLALLFAACSPALCGPITGVDNAACSYGFASRLIASGLHKTYSEVVSDRQQRVRNQPKIAVGMTRDDVYQLLGPPGFGGVFHIDSSGTWCNWTDSKIPASSSHSVPTYRSLTVSMNPDRRVTSIGFQPEISVDPRLLKVESKRAAQWAELR